MKNETIIYGLWPAIEAIKSGKEIEKILIQKGLKNERFHELRELINTHSIPYQYVPVEKLQRIRNQNHQGIICYISPITYQPIDNLIQGIFESGEIPLILILDKITDVRNIGAICRTAECAGVHVIILPDRGSALMSADAVKASAGALLKITFHRSKNLKTTIEYLKNSGLKIVAATEKAQTYHYETDMNGPLAIIMGSEEKGISPEYLKMVDLNVKIPLYGEIESLNVSVATGVLLYETLRQRI